jgi:hypothetical protein
MRSTAQPWFVVLVLLPALLVGCGSDPDVFAKPTDVFVAPNGEVYISDGYENTRVARFDPRGLFLDDWGEAGSEPGHLTSRTASRPTERIGSTSRIAAMRGCRSSTSAERSSTSGAGPRSGARGASRCRRTVTFS